MGFSKGEKRRERQKMGTWKGQSRFGGKTQFNSLDFLLIISIGTGITRGGFWVATWSAK